MAAGSKFTWHETYKKTTDDIKELNLIDLK